MNTKEGCQVGCLGLSSYNGNEGPLLLQNPEVDIAKELTELSTQERNQIYEDVHGVDRPIEETPELIEKCLAQMQIEIDKLNNSSNNNTTLAETMETYNLALQKDKKYVEDPAFRLVFLRCDRFQPQHAAKRYVKYYHRVKYLFGEDALCRALTFEGDLGKEEQAELREGHVQFLSQRDSAGRMVHFLDPIKLM